MTKELKVQRDEAVTRAEAMLEEDKFLDATRFYEQAAQISKELGEMEEFQKYRDLAEDCLALRLELIVIEEEERRAQMETTMMPPPKPKRSKKAKKKKKLTVPAFKKQLDQLMKDSKKSFIPIVDAMQTLEIPQTEVMRLAEKAGYRVTKVRIYAEDAEEKEASEDEFSDLDDLDEVLASEEGKE